MEGKREAACHRLPVLKCAPGDEAGWKRYGKRLLISGRKSRTGGPIFRKKNPVFAEKQPFRTLEGRNGCFVGILFDIPAAEAVPGDPQEADQID